MKKYNIVGVMISVIIYFILYPAGSACGLIHPACYAYVGTVLPLLFGSLYLNVASRMKCFGAAVCLNGFVLLLGFIAGEGNAAFAIILVMITLIAEIVRKLNGYDTIKGVRYSFIPFAYSFYAYTAHWWTNTSESLGEALEEMPLGYADKMEAVINNVPALVVALILVVPVAILGMMIAEKLLKKQAALFTVS